MLCFKRGFSRGCVCKLLVNSFLSCRVIAIHVYLPQIPFPNKTSVRPVGRVVATFCHIPQQSGHNSGSVWMWTEVATYRHTHKCTITYTLAHMGVHMQQPTQSNHTHTHTAHTQHTHKHKQSFIIIYFSQMYACKQNQCRTFKLSIKLGQRICQGTNLTRHAMSQLNVSHNPSAYMCKHCIVAALIHI